VKIRKFVVLGFGKVLCPLSEDDKYPLLVSIETPAKMPIMSISSQLACWDRDCPVLPVGVLHQWEMRRLRCLLDNPLKSHFEKGGFVFSFPPDKGGNTKGGY
jgi:hypothetical protein